MDVRQRPDAPLVFMDDGDARALRAAAQAGQLVCPFRQLQRDLEAGLERLQVLMRS